MKKIKLAIKFILLHILNFFNNFMILITNKKVDWFKKNKMEIACAIIGILTLVSIAANNVKNDYPQVTCYIAGWEEETASNATNVAEGFFDTLKSIFFLK